MTEAGEKAWTKGPWKLHKPSAVWQVNQDAAYLNPVALVVEKKPKEECEANAHLISAAPEMAEAMQEFVDRCDRGEVRSVKTYAKFKEILAKARGER